MKGYRPWFFLAESGKRLLCAGGCVLDWAEPKELNRLLFAYDLLACLRDYFNYCCQVVFGQINTHLKVAELLDKQQK